MKQNAENKKYIAWLFGILALVCMGVIFWFSSRTGEQSAGQSSPLIDWLTARLGERYLMAAIFIIRKGAHCLEFTGLSVLFAAALYFSHEEIQFFEGIALTSLYAITDEVHQIFVEGRSCQIMDWAIDTLGAVLGAVGFVILYRLITAVISKKRAPLIK